MGPRGISTVFVAVGPKHPEGWPDTGSVGEFDAGGNFTVTEGLFLGGVKTGGGVLVGTVLVGFVDGFDDELTIFDISVFFVVSVALPLLVIASSGFDLAVPVGSVEVGGVEFIGPNEFPVFDGSRHKRSIWS